MFFFFLLWPLFARAPRHGFLENFLLSARVCKVFFFWLRSVGRLGGARAKKNTTQGVFFCSGPGERQGKEKPRWAPARGQSKKKHHPGCFFFAPALGAGTGPEPKKKHHPGCCFFLLRPRGKAGEGEVRWAPRRGQSKKNNTTQGVFFAPAPGKGRGRRSPVGRRHGARAKKNTSQGVFFFCSGLGRRHGARAKKKHHPGCFFFFFAPAPGREAGEGEASLGAGAGPEQKKKTPPRVFFFVLRPWAPARGQRTKKKHHPGVIFFCSGPGERQGKEKLRWAPARGQSKKNTTQGVFFDPALGAGTGPEQNTRKHPGCFFCSGPGERQGKEKPRWAPARGQSKNPGCFCFCSGPGERQGKEKRRWAPARGQSKKNKHHPGCVFFFTAAEGKGRRSSVGRRHGARAKKKNTTQGVFFLAPASGKGRGRRSPVGRRHGARAKKKNQGVLFCSGLGCRHGARAKKNTTQGVFFLLRPRGKAGEGEASLGAGTGPEQKKNTTQGVSFFDPALGAGTGPEQNKKNTKGVFFAPAPGQGRGRRSPVGRRHGARAKTQGVFFCSGPGERQGKEKRRWAPARGQSKKINTTQGVCFFLVRPKAREGEAPLGAGTGPEPKKKHHPGCCFFCSGPGERQGKKKPRWAPARGQSKKKNTTHGDLLFWLRPRRMAGEGEAPLGAGAGPEQKKKHHPGCVCVCVFFFCCGPGERQGKEKPRWAPARGQSKKRKTPRVFLFFLLRPRQKAGEGGRRDLSAGPELTVGWGDFGKAGWCFFFLLWPRRVFFG